MSGIFDEIDRKFVKIKEMLIELIEMMIASAKIRGEFIDDDGTIFKWDRSHRAWITKENISSKSVEVEVSSTPASVNRPKIVAGAHHPSDFGEDLVAAGLRVTTDGKLEILNVVDCARSGDNDASHLDYLLKKCSNMDQGQIVTEVFHAIVEKCTLQTGVFFGACIDEKLLAMGLEIFVAERIRPTLEDIFLALILEDKDLFMEVALSRTLMFEAVLIKWGGYNYFNWKPP